MACGAFAAQWSPGVKLTNPAPFAVSATADYQALANQPYIVAIIGPVNAGEAIGFCTPVSNYFYYRVESVGTSVARRLNLVFYKQTCS